MKVPFILLISFIILNGCSSSKDMANTQNIQVMNATYKKWSEPPLTGSDVPERGIDLSLIVQNWPQKYSPKFIIYNNRKSLSATVNDSLPGKVVITGRIIQMSGVMRERSERINLSDRLVFENNEGETGYVEIEEWERKTSEQ